MLRNICNDKDAYKDPHHLCMKPGMTHNEGYGEHRKGAKYAFTNWFGMDIIIQDNFLTVPSLADIEEAKEESFMTFGQQYFNEEVWLKVRKLGYIPMEIKALPEGLNVPVGNALFTYQSTEPWFASTLPSLETLLMHSWYPSTISTRTKVIKESIRPLVEKSGSIELLEFLINDFGARGTTWYDSAAVGGMAVLIHGQGSDNMIASRHIKNYYGYKGRAKSIWATEHSVALSFGPGAGEKEYLKHQLTNAPKDATIAVVIDTYDSRKFMFEVVADAEIVALIKGRSEAGGNTVFRPDSGIPIEQVEMVFDALTGIFGYTHNAKGYKILKYGVRCIQGDGMNEESIFNLYSDIIKNRWSTDNLFVGSGGGLLQVDANRDTQRAAIKPSFGIINGIDVNFQKNPKSDPSKASKTGRLKVIEQYGNQMQTISSVNLSKYDFGSASDLLRTVYKNGEMFNKNNFSEIIERSNRPLPQILHTSEVKLFTV